MSGLDGIIYMFGLVLFVNVNNFYLKCSYTIPHKEAGFNCCDEIDPIAKVSNYAFSNDCNCTVFHTLMNQDI